jgi:hypothetical protein
MTMSWALTLVMTGSSCKITREMSCARMNGEWADIVSRAEACAASTDDGLVHPFGDIMNKIIGDKVCEKNELRAPLFLHNTMHGN